MNCQDIEIVHRNGKKVTITDIPIVTKDREFYLRWNIEKLIDIINESSVPDDVYSLSDKRQHE